jgi:hypothetical protein
VQSTGPQVYRRVPSSELTLEVTLSLCTVVLDILELASKKPAKEPHQKIVQVASQIIYLPCQWTISSGPG